MNAKIDSTNSKSPAGGGHVGMVLRYTRHHFTASGLASPKIAEELSDWLAD